jgi:hypothetical protein
VLTFNHLGLEAVRFVCVTGVGLMARELFARMIWITLLAAPLTAAAAERRSFPYEAVVTATEAEVHSGHGKDKGHYVTGRLRQGAKVTVHRQDPGGWYMIIPPRGSFSWVPAKSVKREGNVGTVIANAVPVRVGTVDGDDHTVEHRRLSVDDQVKILGEKFLATSPTSTAELWYKIEPPQREWRWIKGHDVTAASQADEMSAAEVRAARKEAAGPTPAEKAARSTPVHRPQKEAPAIRKTSEPEEEPVAEADLDPDAQETRGYLAELDAEFERITGLEKSQWDFAQLEAAYRDAQSRSKNPVTQRVIDRRLSSIREYSREASVHQVLFSLTDEARQRDAELAARQAELEARLANPQRVMARRVPGPAMGRQPTPVPMQALQPQPVPSHPQAAQGGPSFPRLAAPQFDTGIETAQQPFSRQPTAIQPQPAMGQRPSPRFDGAGIVQAAPAGAPAPFVLTTRDGRVLAFLAPQPGVNLTGWVGRPAGIHGARSHRAELRADEIKVTGLEPVRLH